MDLKQPLEIVVQKIFDEASKTGVVSKEQLELILLYERQNKKDNNLLLNLVGNGEIVLDFINKIFK